MPEGLAQVTWRAPEELIARVRHAAAQRGSSVNEFVTRMLDAATDPALADDESLRVRERLAAAGRERGRRPARRTHGRSVLGL